MNGYGDCESKISLSETMCNALSVCIHMNTVCVTFLIRKMGTLCETMTIFKQLNLKHYKFLRCKVQYNVGMFM